MTNYRYNNLMMKLNHNFCVAANKVISRSPIASYYADLKSMDSSSYETVELYMDALKEMVIYHNELLRSGKFDNNQLLRFNSLANKLLKGYSNGVIPRLPNHLPTIEQKPMNILKSIKSWLAPQAEMNTADALEAKIASIKARKEAESAKAKELLKSKNAEDKETARLKVGTQQLKVTAKEYVAAIAKTRRLEAELAKAQETRLEAEVDAENALISIDDEIENMILNLDLEEVPTPRRKKETVSIPLVEEETDDLWAETASVDTPPIDPIVPSVLKEETETKPETKGGEKPKTGKSRKPKDQSKGKRPSSDKAFNIKATTKVIGEETETENFELVSEDDLKGKIASEGISSLWDD